MKKIDSGKRVRPTTEKDDNPSKKMISEDDDNLLKKMRKEEEEKESKDPVSDFYTELDGGSSEYSFSESSFEFESDSDSEISKEDGFWENKSTEDDDSPLKRKRREEKKKKKISPMANKRVRSMDGNPFKKMTKEEKKVFVKAHEKKEISENKRVRSMEEDDDNPLKKMRMTREEKKEISNYDREDGFAEEDDTPFKRMRREEKKVFVVKPVTYYKKDSEESESDEEESNSESDEEESNSESDNEISDPRSNYDWDGFSENEYYQDQAESDEEIIRHRKEKDHGYNIILKQGRTITHPRRPRRTYIPRSSKHCNSVLDELDQPLVVFAKIALARYNAIQGKNYEYYALVKAYNIVVGGFVFWIRFKAFLTAQDPIDFEAVVYQGIPDKPKPGQKRRDCEVDIKFVYPLP